MQIPFSRGRRLLRYTERAACVQAAPPLSRKHDHTHTHTCKVQRRNATLVRGVRAHLLCVASARPERRRVAPKYIPLPLEHCRKQHVYMYVCIYVRLTLFLFPPLLRRRLLAVYIYTRAIFSFRFTMGAREREDVSCANTRVGYISSRYIRSVPARRRLELFAREKSRATGFERR